MSINKEILDAIRQINLALAETINEAEKNESSAFYKESIKLSALHIFEKAQLLSENLKRELKATDSTVKISESSMEDRVTVKEIINLKSESETLPVETKTEGIMVSETKTVFEQPQPLIQVQKTILPDKQPIKNTASPEDISFNEKIAKYKLPVINIADKMKDTPIKELVKAISISKKFEFINELFDGNASAYKDCLQIIESKKTFEESAKHIEDNIAVKYHWKENENLAAEFFALIKRRFI